MKKITILFSTLGLVIIGALVWSVNYLSTGTVIITTDKGNTITLQKSTAGKPFTKIGLGSISTKIHHGLYLATVKNGSQTSVQVITFKNGHRTLRYSINLSGLGTVEPVAYKNAEGMAANNNQVVYVNTDTAHIDRIDAQNNISQLNTSQYLHTVRWADPSFGVAQDTNGHLFSVVNGTVKELNVPFTYTESAVNFDVSVDKQIYISNGAVVYRGSYGGGFKKIYAATTSKPILAAGAKAVAIADTPEDTQDGNKPLLAIVTTNDKIIKKAINASRIAWSLSGQYLLDEAGASVYDLSLRKVAIIPTSPYIGYAGWINDNKFLYATNDNELWSYSTPDQRAELLAVTPLHKSITGLTISSDKAYAYLTTTNASTNQSIGRVGLQGQQVSPLLRRLGETLPLTLNDGSVSLINFGQPLTAVVESSPETNLPIQVYIQEAQTALTANGIDVSQLQFKLVQGG